MAMTKLLTATLKQLIQKGFKSNWYVFGAQMPQM